MTADHTTAALMITTAIVWLITGCLRDLRERAEAERVAAEDQARTDFDEDAWVAQYEAISDAGQVHAAKRLRDAAFGYDPDEPGPLAPSDSPIFDATAAHLAHAEAARDLRDERIARWLDGAS